MTETPLQTPSSVEEGRGGALGAGAVIGPLQPRKVHTGTGRCPKEVMNVC